MKIGLVVPGFSADVEDWCIPALRDLVQRLASSDQVRVVSVRYPGRAGRYRLFGAEIIALGGGPRQGRRSLPVWGGVLRTLAAEHRRDRFDLLHAFWANETGALTALAGRVLGIPSVMSLAGGEMVGLRDIGYGGQLVRTERWKARTAMALARLVTAGSRYLLDLAARKAPGGVSGKLRLAPLGVDLNLFHPGHTATAQPQLRLVHVGSLVPVKDQGTLLQALARMRAGGLPVRLEVAGRGPMEGRLRKLAEQLGLEDAVTFVGEVPHHELPRFCQGASLCVQSSRHEAQGMAVLEAAALGIPLVGTGVGVLPELAPDAAVSVPARDHDAMAEAAAQLLGDPDRLAGTGEAARRRVESEFELGRAARRFRDIYSEITR